VKNSIAIAGMLAATTVLITPAHATSVMFGFTTPNLTTYGNPGTSASFASSPSGFGTVGVYGYDNVLPQNTYSNGNTIGTTNKDTPSTGSPEAITTSSVGLGLANPTNDPTYIGIEDAVVLDFSNVSSSVLQNATGVTIDMNIEHNGPSEWVVFGYNSTTQKFTVLDEASMSSGTTAQYTSTTGIYSSYLVGVSNDDCALTVTQVDIAYNGVVVQQTPEPGTFVMAGMALVAVGITMRKRNRKV
jgi:hypothetical protein